MDKNDPIIRAELEEIKNWLIKSSEVEVDEKQELVVSIVALITNKRFQQNIRQLRKKYQIPKTWYTTEKQNDLYAEYLKHCKAHPDAPTMPYDEPIVNLCKRIGVDVKKYSDFVLGYLYYGYVLPLKPDQVDWYQPLFTKDEHRYKANIELDYGDSTEEKEEMEIKKGYIRFYGDTTPNQLTRFIKDNWRGIQAIQSQLKPYQHTKKHSQFRRDILIYLFHLFGNKSPEIMDKIVTDELNYPLDYVEVRQIISDLKNRINKILP